MVRSKPPSNQPQVTPLVFSRSPMFLLVMVAVTPDVVEHVSPVGSESPIMVRPPLPSATAALLEGVPLAGMSPSVCPEIRLTAPGLEGPKFVVHMLSLRAYCCA